MRKPLTNAVNARDYFAPTVIFSFTRVFILVPNARAVENKYFGVVAGAVVINWGKLGKDSKTEES